MKPALFALALVLLVVPAHGQDHHAGHGAASAGEQPATIAYRDANMRMHRDMDIDYSGNADVDFIRGMIPHHKGAIDMARIVLEHGSDPKVRKLAVEVIAAQESEVAWMENWLKAKGY
jgi:uncharacterized protein (DUF305 family)